MRSLEVFDSNVGVMKMKREMLKSLRECYNYLESNEYYAIATLLDPHFKQKIFPHLHQQLLQSKCLLQYIKHWKKKTASPNIQGYNQTAVQVISTVEVL